MDTAMGMGLDKAWTQEGHGTNMDTAMSMDRGTSMNMDMGMSMNIDMGMSMDIDMDMDMDMDADIAMGMNMKRSKTIAVTGITVIAKSKNSFTF
jgi:hypothetical protein